MIAIILREVTQASFSECIKLKVAPDQEPFVAPNVYSLAQAKVNSRLSAFAIYDGDVYGRDPGADDPMVGFLMYQVMEGVGFIVRLMIDERYQQRGYGRAAMVEVIRRFKLMPEIEYIGTSVAKENGIAEALYRDLGFVDGDRLDERELYLRLDWDPYS